MGLLKAGIGALSGVLSDQWRDYFYCEALDADVLAAKGEKRAGKRSANRKSSENIITDGSIIAVNEGQCMMIVEQGKVVEVCAEPGEFVYDTSTEPSVFSGDLSDSVRKCFLEIGKRFTFGGEAPKDQRVYFFNTKEIVGNKYGTPSPVPFRVIDSNIGLDMDISIRCHGEYSYRITNPLLFYTNVCGNVEYIYEKEKIEGQLKTELLTALQPAFAKISDMGVRYSSLPGHTMELSNALNEILSSKWKDLRGIEIVAFGVSSVKASEEDEKMIKELQRNAAFKNPTMAAAHMVGAQAQAMQNAAKNSAGAMNGFYGINMAQDVGGMNAENLYVLGKNQPAEQNNPSKPIAESWNCSCGKNGNTGKFCSECGKPKPVSDEWTCSCGSVNTGKFCPNCGSPKPLQITACDSCGWRIDPSNPPKFCPNCGNSIK